MKKFFIAFLVLAAFVVQSAPAFAAYSDDQIVSTLRSRIVRMAKPTRLNLNGGDIVNLNVVFARQMTATFQQTAWFILSF